MLRIRRLYFYVVAYLGLSMLLTGLATLGRVLLEQAFGLESSGVLFGALAGREQLREQVAFGIALVAIGLPVWALHWRTIRGWIGAAEARGTPAGERDGREDDERGSGLRRLYTYGVLATTALTAYVAGRDLIAHLLGLPLRLSSGSELVGEIVRPLPYILVAGLFWAYHWRVAATDRAQVGERGASATLRRWYLYGLAALGVVPLMVNLATLLQQLWVLVFDRGGIAALGPSAAARTVAEASGTTLVALAVWLAHRAWAETSLAEPRTFGEDERHSTLRKVYLYAIVGGAVAWALANAAEVARFLLLGLLGESIAVVDGEPTLVALGRPLANIAVFGVFWALFWRAVRREAAVAEVGRQAGVRRLYFYLVAGVALAILAGSLAGLLRLLADVLLGGPTVGADSRRELAGQLSRLLIALPVWLLHWRAIRRRVAGAGAAEETRAATRRFYLYLVAFAAIAVLLVSGAGLIYHLVTVALGQAIDRGLAREVAHGLVNAAVAGVLLWYHWWLVLRADLAELRQAVAGRTAVATLAGLDAEAVARLERFVRDELPAARIRLAWSDEEVVSGELRVQSDSTLPS